MSLEDSVVIKFVLYRAPGLIHSLCLSLIQQSAGLIVKCNEQSLGLDSLLCIPLEVHSDRVSILRSAETLQSINDGGCQQFETQWAKEICD